MYIYSYTLKYKCIHTFIFYNINVYIQIFCPINIKIYNFIIFPLHLYFSYITYSTFSANLKILTQIILNFHLLLFHNFTFGSLLILFHRTYQKLISQLFLSSSYPIYDLYCHLFIIFDLPPSIMSLFLFLTFNFNSNLL